MDPMREFLNSVYEAKIEISRCESKAASLYEAATSVTSRADAEHVSGTAETGQLLAAYADAAREMTQRKLRYLTRMQSVSDFIDMVPGGPKGLWRIVLRLRYVDCLSWKRIADSIPKNEDEETYTERHIIRLHGEALNAARRIWKGQISI